MDVWFDSIEVVLERRRRAARFELPGRPVPRGIRPAPRLVQSSLLTSVAANGAAPYKTILTHGFVLDEKAQDVQESLGNVVDPSLVIEGGKNLGRLSGRVFAARTR